MSSNTADRQPHQQPDPELSGQAHQAPPLLPIDETDQPDPMLQMTTGRIGPGGITLVAVVIACVVAVVFYALNSSTSHQQTVAAPHAASSASVPAGG
jgi:hypothetical protein